MSRATTAEEKIDFINKHYRNVVKAYRTLGKVRPSVCLAMMITESAAGTSKYASEPYNSFLGQKRCTGKTATKYWSGKSFSAKTQECYDQASGQLTTIKDSFRMYDSPEQCVFNYYELLNTKLYKGVTDCDPWEQIQQIKNCGYFTSVTEVDTVRQLIKQFNLERFDKLEYDDEDDDVKPGAYSGGASLPQFSGVVSAMNWMDMDASYEHRAILAQKYGIGGYTGTAKQNEQLMMIIAQRALMYAAAVMGRE